ncbi:MAG: hypothetical protein AB7O96_05055 [Pseudobdellovibrionaceae bacterium]
MNVKSLLSILLGTLGFISNSLAQDAIKQPNADIRHMLPASAALYITPRGQKYFEKNMQAMLETLGVDFRSGYFEPMTIAPKNTIDLKDIAKVASPADRAMLLEIKKFMESWLIGFTLNSHKPKIFIGESGYVASFKKLSLTVDQAMMDSLKKTDGAVVVIDLEIDKLNYGTEVLKIEDLGNPTFGAIQAHDVKLNLAQDSKPIRIRVPFYVNLNAAGILEFKTLGTSSNFSEAKLNFEYQKMDPLQIKLFVKGADGKDYEVNNAMLQPLIEGKLKENIPQFLPKVAGYLDTFVKEELPTWLNQKAYEFLLGKLEQVDYMEVPNAPPGSTPFVFGLRLERLQLKNKNLMIQLAGFVEDPKNPDSKPLVADNAVGAPHLSLKNAEDFDMAMFLNRSIVNRILQLASERGAFKQIDVSSEGSSGKDVLKLVGAPKVIAFANQPNFPVTSLAETYAKLRVRIEKETEGFQQSLALKNPFQIEFDLIVKLRPGPDGKLQIILWKIDENSIGDMSQYIKRFSGQVIKGVKESLVGFSNQWEADRQRGKELKLPGTLPLPPEIAGLKTKVQSLLLDPNGYLVLYLTYGGVK